jgi:hypothetical protein
MTTDRQKTLHVPSGEAMMPHLGRQSSVWLIGRLSTGKPWSCFLGLLLLVGVAVMASAPAHAQNCGAWSNVQGWTATYRGTRSGTGKTGGGVITISIDDKVAADFNFNSPPFIGGTTAWSSDGVTGTSSVNESEVINRPVANLSQRGHRMNS